MTERKRASLVQKRAARRRGGARRDWRLQFGKAWRGLRAVRSGGRRVGAGSFPPPQPPRQLANKIGRGTRPVTACPSVVTFGIAIQGDAWLCRVREPKMKRC